MSTTKFEFPKPSSDAFRSIRESLNELPVSTPGASSARDSTLTVDASLFSHAFNSSIVGAAKKFGESALDAFVGFGDAMDKMSARTGFGVEALSALSHAAGQCGTTLETIEAASRGATNVWAQAANGSKEAADKFARLGLSVDELLAQAPEEQFRTLVRAIASVENPTLRLAYAMQIFGEQGAQLGPMINGGADALDAYLQEAKDAGVVTTRDAATGAANLSDAFGLPRFLPFLKDERERLGARYLIGVTIGFPSGQETTAYKVRQAKDLIAAGADEVDMAMNVGYLLSGMERETLDDIKAVKEAAGAILEEFAREKENAEWSKSGVGLAEVGGWTSFAERIGRKSADVRATSLVCRRISGIMQIDRLIV